MTTMPALIDQHRDAIIQLCRRFGVVSLEAFGSVLRDDFDSEHSDIDLLVEFAPGATRRFSDFLDFKQALEAVFQRPVDLIEPQAISNQRLRHHIVSSKASIYRAAA